MKIFLLSFIVFCVSCSSSIAQKQYNFSLTIPGFSNQTVYVAQTKGDMSVYIDTVASNAAGVIETTFSAQTESGLYSIIFPQLHNSETIFIFNKEDVHLRASVAQVQLPEVLSSKENSLYYKFQLLRKTFLSHVDMLDYIFDQYKGEVFLQNTEAEYVRLVEEFNTNVHNITTQAKGTFVEKIIRSTVPVFPKKLVSSFDKKIFLQTHYFDNINFADESLLNTPVFTSACLEYLSLYTEDYQIAKNNSVFMQAVDSILQKTAHSQKVHESVVNYLLSGFETMKAHDVLEHISARYLEENQCTDNDSKSTLERKALSNTKLAIGKSVPKVAFTDINGKKYANTFFSKGKHVVVFWSSSCPYCTQIVPSLILDSDQKKRQDYTLTLISLDTSLDAYKTYASRIPGIQKTVQVCDAKSWDGDLAQAYYLYATPTIFIINDGKIEAKPIDYDEYLKSMKKLGLL